MIIGIMGAPGSGKSSLARALATKLNERDDFRSKWTVVDDYVPKLAKRTGLSYGHNATLPQNMEILFERWTREQEVEEKGGQVIASVTYAGMYLTTEDYIRGTPLSFLQGKITMEYLGVLEDSIGAYNVVFYLPYNAKTKEKKGRSYDMVLDQQVPEVAKGFDRSFVTLEGPLKSKVAHALSTISTLEAQATTAADE